MQTGQRIWTTACGFIGEVFSKSRDLAVVSAPGSVEEKLRDYHLPRTAGDLLPHSRLITASTREGEALAALIKEIGSDALREHRHEAAR